MWRYLTVGVVFVVIAASLVVQRFLDFSKNNIRLKAIFAVGIFAFTFQFMFKTVVPSALQDPADINWTKLYKFFENDENANKAAFVLGLADSKEKWSPTEFWSSAFYYSASRRRVEISSRGWTQMGGEDWVKELLDKRRTTLDSFFIVNAPGKYGSLRVSDEVINEIDRSLTNFSYHSVGEFQVFEIHRQKDLLIDLLKFFEIFERQIVSKTPVGASYLMNLNIYQTVLYHQVGDLKNAARTGKLVRGFFDAAPDLGLWRFAVKNIMASLGI